jgi:ferredoxin--NADP+ reductase
MYKILKKRGLNPTVTLMEIEALLVAKKADPGQFIMLRTDKKRRARPADHSRF